MWVLKPIFSGSLWSLCCDSSIATDEEASGIRIQPEAYASSAGISNEKAYEDDVGQIYSLPDEGCESMHNGVPEGLKKLSSSSLCFTKSESNEAYDRLNSAASEYRTHRMVHERQASLNSFDNNSVEATEVPKDKPLADQGECINAPDRHYSLDMSDRKSSSDEKRTEPEHLFLKEEQTDQNISYSDKKCDTQREISDDAKSNTSSKQPQSIKSGQLNNDTKILNVYKASDDDVVDLVPVPNLNISQESPKTPYAIDVPFSLDKNPESEKRIGSDLFTKLKAKFEKRPDKSTEPNSDAGKNTAKPFKSPLSQMDIDDFKADTGRSPEIDPNNNKTELSKIKAIKPKLPEIGTPSTTKQDNTKKSIRPIQVINTTTAQKPILDENVVHNNQQNTPKNQNTVSTPQTKKDPIGKVEECQKSPISLKEQKKGSEKQSDEFASHGKEKKSGKESSRSRSKHDGKDFSSKHSERHSSSRGHKSTENLKSEKGEKRKHSSRDKHGDFKSTTSKSSHRSKRVSSKEGDSRGKKSPKDTSSKRGIDTDSLMNSQLKSHRSHTKSGHEKVKTSPLGASGDGLSSRHGTHASRSIADRKSLQVSDKNLKQALERIKARGEPLIGISSSNASYTKALIQSFFLEPEELSLDQLKLHIHGMVKEKPVVGPSIAIIAKQLVDAHKLLMNRFLRLVAISGPVQASILIDHPHLIKLIQNVTTLSEGTIKNKITSCTDKSNDFNRDKFVTSIYDADSGENEAKQQYKLLPKNPTMQQCNQHLVQMVEKIVSNFSKTDNTNVVVRALFIDSFKIITLEVFCSLAKKIYGIVRCLKIISMLAALKPIMENE